MNATSRSLGLGGVAALAIALLALPSTAQDLDRGAELFQLCAQCHGPDAGGNQMFLAPAIAGLPEWYIQGQLHKFRDGGRGTHFDDIGGMRMRPMSQWLHSDEDVANVAAYVASMPKTWPKPTLEGGDPEAGKVRYAPCIACHQANAEGNEALKAPPLVGISDWYAFTSLKHFKSGVRGTNPKDTTGMLMRPMSMTLADDQAIKDVIAYIETLGH